MNNFNNNKKDSHQCRLDVINRNYTNIINSDELEQDFDIETQAPFSEILKQNQYYDEMYNNLKKNKHYFNSQFQSMTMDDFKRYNANKESYGYFQFPDRSLKSFVELDEINSKQYNEHTYLLKKLAAKKYRNLYNAYNLPYQHAIEQNEIGNMFENTDRARGGFIINHPLSPYNNNWVLDDKEEREIVGAIDKDDSMLYSVGGGLITSNKEFIDRIDPKVMELKKKSLGYIEPTSNTPMPKPTNIVRPVRTPRPTNNTIVNVRGLLD
jgi:hypothetical protein